MVNKVVASNKAIRTSSESNCELEEAGNLEQVKPAAELQIILNNVKLQEYCWLVHNVLHEGHRMRCMDDDFCIKETERPRAAYVNLHENRVDQVFESGPASQELFQATSLVFRALHDTIDVGQRRCYEEKTINVEFDEDTNGRIRTFGRLVHKSLKTEEEARELRMERRQSNRNRT